MPEKRRLVYFIASLLLLGFVLTSIGSYFVSRDALREQIMSSGLPLTADNIYTAIQNDLIPPIFVSSLMAQDTFLRDWALAGEQDPDRVIRYLDQIQQRYETVTAFYVSENTRNYYHPSGIVEQISRDDPTDAWFFRVRDMEDSYEINVDYDEANNFSLTIFVNYKVFDYEGRFIGVTGVGLLVDNVRELVERYRKRFERRIYFVDATGGIVLSGNRFDETRPNIYSMPGIGRIAEAILATDVGSFTYTVDGETVLLSYRYIEELEWHVLVEQREGTVTREVWNTLLVSLAFQLTVALVVIAATSATINIYQRRLEKMAMTDTLTGLASRQALEYAAEQTLREVRRGRYPVSVILFDLDRFKRINDHHGHLAGDAVLREVAALVREQVREADLVCRWGGEEFLIWLKQCDRDNAAQIAEKIRLAVAEHQVAFQSSQLSVTASLGVAELREEEALDNLTARVDQALYRAKQAGRNQVAVD